jgi:putative selenate reductase
MAGEYRAKASIYEIPERVFREMFELEGASAGLEVMGGKASLPVGPAAGPNSQIAPNVIAAYLAGSRVFELKTVQENDSLDIEKPCIDALDEGHNVEWSTELSLADARGEYLRAWMAVNLLAAIWSPRPRDFIFNISVGYTLDGIRGQKVDAYLEGMRKPGLGPSWASDLAVLSRFVEGQQFRTAFGAEAAARAGRLLDAFPAEPVHSVTLSTMHGCPPAEIERIGRYLIEEKGFDVYVKLNPTLLGYDRARAILDETGWKDILLKRESFEHDLQWKDALSLIAALGGSASARGRRFGIKLSNTLANANTGGRLSGGERYMSGRALFPITARLAADLATALPDFGQRFSYCGGVSALNAYELIRAGVGPLTVATDVLKPGGYLRFASMARAAVAALPASARVPDAAKLASLAEESLGRPEYRKGFKESDSHIAKPLPLFDCFAAPCIEACPARQKVPEYLRRAAHAAEAANRAGDSAAGDAAAADGAKAAWAEALATIVADNPLPRITGVLCDHACQGACSRLDYEGSVRIRDVKLACSRSGEVPVRKPEAEPFKGRVAVVGAGPAGLACAWYLSLWGAPVTVFDGSADAGGVPADVIPRFRITRGDLASDIERIKGLGAAFHFGKRIKDTADLGAAATGGPFTAVFLASGAPVARRLELAGEGPAKIDALSFLSEISAAEGRSSAPPFAGAKHIAVAGGGNTAMDAVRAALRLKGIEKVSLLYRRTMAEMPADREETAAALAEGAVLEELALPEAASKDAAGTARLRVRRMKLGEKDASGRRSPLPSDETFELDCDLLVEALGETCDPSFMKAFGVEVGRDGRPVFDPETKKARGPAGSPAITVGGDVGIPPPAIYVGGDVGISAPAIYVGGDAARGPASIIAACADGKKAAYAILRQGGVEPVDATYVAPDPDAAQLATRGKLAFPLEGEEGSPDFVLREAERCLECDSACLRCVEVCPNRANIAIPTGDGAAGRQAFQILHVDSLCNECGNCGFFCPWEGEPFRGKPALFATKAELEASRNAGFAILLSGHGETDARPGLAFRASPDGPVSTLSYEEWGLEDAPRGATSPEAAAMAALAAVVLRDHPYLVSGGRS